MQSTFADINKYDLNSNNGVQIALHVSGTVHKFIIPLSIKQNYRDRLFIKAAFILNFKAEHGFINTVFRSFKGCGNFQDDII